MLKMYGNLYATEKSDFDEVVNALKKEGFDIAYQADIAGVIIKEVGNLEHDEHEDQNT